LEYFISSRGARKGLADTALRTADSGYLTRRLVDVSQEVIIREEDCGADIGIEVYDIKEGKNVIEPLSERLVGRYLIENFYHPVTGELVMDNEHMMTDADAERIVATGVERLKIRSVLNCKAKHGVCKKCYGANLANGKLVSQGEAVGIVAAQSIGEPGTQLTMRTFHTGGIASAEDITQGLPRVEELFEARRPKKAAVLAEATGVITHDLSERDVKDNCTPVIITTDEGEEVHISIPFGLKFREALQGTRVEKGQIITDGVINPHDVLRLLGDIAAQDYLIKEVQNVYRLQGVDINDKHIEVIVRQMIRKVRIDENPQPDMLLGTLVDRYDVEDRNKELQARIDAGETDVKLIVASPVLLGITKASLATDSFLSAASFQETTKVLTDAAIRGKVDPLVGLKENVIIGRLVPAGTGMEQYRNLELDAVELPEASEEDLIG
jgi:DNA-directed RNA polymerase subunit beta'